MRNLYEQEKADAQARYERQRADDQARIDQLVQQYTNLLHLKFDELHGLQPPQPPPSGDGEPVAETSQFDADTPHLSDNARLGDEFTRLSEDIPRFGDVPRSSLANSPQAQNQRERTELPLPNASDPSQDSPQLPLP
jgi:hypothetical protein